MKNISKLYLANIEVEEKSTLEVITYLKTRCYKISTAEIKHINRMFEELWDPKEPIKSYFKRIKECVAFAKDAADSDDITSKTHIQMILTSIDQMIDFKLHNRD